MADKKITELNALTIAGINDVLAIVDVALPETKKITVADLFASPQPIGSSLPSTGAFTTLELLLGATINEFSTDTTLAGDSNTAVPTERAVKTYVDTEIASLNVGFTVKHVYANDNAIDKDAVLCDTTAGNITITLIPTPNGMYIVKKITSDSNTVIVQGNSGLVDGSSQFVISNFNESYTFLCDGDDFYIV